MFAATQLRISAHPVPAGPGQAACRLGAGSPAAPAALPHGRQWLGKAADRAEVRTITPQTAF